MKFIDLITILITGVDIVEREVLHSIVDEIAGLNQLGVRDRSRCEHRHSGEG